MQTPAETFGQLNNLFVAHQPHYVPQAIVNGRAMTTSPKVILNLQPQLRREVALQVIG
jgi:hypothetical protein